MSRRLLLVVMLGLTVAQARGADIASQTLDIFTQRCAACHGAQVEKPKGKFGFINDLHRLVADRDYIVPGDPDGSGLWQEIDFGDMPPEETKHGMLTQVEKDTIRQWIAEGAKVPVDLQKTPVASEPVAEATFSIGRLIAFVGRFHPVVVHFPIALVLVALVPELLRRQQAARLCLGLGALGAIVAAAIGWALWLHTAAMGERATYMTLHQWGGTAMAVWVAFTWWLGTRKPGESGSPNRRKAYYTALVVAAAGIGLVGHWGGLLAWGVNYFRW